MSIVRYNTKEFVPASFSSIVDRFFNDSMARSGGSIFIPKVDVIENAESFEIHFAAPGLSKEDFKIELNDNHLRVSGDRKWSDDKKDKNYHSIETQYGAFARSFNLPDNVDGSKINAKYNNGILELTIPKDEKKVLKQTIKVN